ncbi:MAG: hypothetical protein HY548_05080, partial [Elusimicrobia bacterium]|nr:hypothetical protein [Elusimicrobiota bacterium]
QYDASDLPSKRLIERTDAQGHTTFLLQEYTYKEGASSLKPDSQKVESLIESVLEPGSDSGKARAAVAALTPQTQLSLSAEMSKMTEAIKENGKTRVREAIQYDDKGNTTRYREKETDENGRTMERWWWGGEYDGNDNLTSYSELTRADGEDTYVQWSGTYVENSDWGRYDQIQDPGAKANFEKRQSELTSKDRDYMGRSRWRLSGYSKDVQGSDGTSQKETWDRLSYNSSEDLVGYQRKTRDSQRNEITILWGRESCGDSRCDAAYDAQGRVMDYQQVTQDSASGTLQTMRLSGVEYNIAGDMAAYTETLTEGDQSRTRTVTGAVYDEHDLASYHEVVVDSQGQSLVRDWKSQSYEKGKLKGFTEKLVYKQENSIKDFVVERTVTDIAYDALGRQSGSQERSRAHGFLTTGEAVDVVTETNVTRESEELVEREEMLGGEAGAVFKRRFISGLRETRTVSAYDTETREEFRRLIETTVRDGMTAGGDFHEVKTTADPTGQKLSATQETWRRSVKSDGLGRVREYRETVVRDGKPGSKIERQVGNLFFNVDGNMVSETETVTSAAGGTTVSTRDDMHYDALGRLTRYRLDTTAQADGMSRKTSVTRDQIQYNATGDAIRYHERSTRGDNALVEDVIWQGSYNAYGQIAESRQTTRRDGEADGRSFHTTDQTTTTGMTYNLEGALWGYIEKNVSSAAPDKITSTILENAQYNDAGQMVSFKQTRREMDSTRRVLNSETVTERSGAVYNALGLLVRYMDTTREGGITTVTNVLWIEYDEDGRIVEMVTESYKMGEEARTVYARPDGRDLSPMDLAALMALEPEKTLEDFLEEGAVVARQEVGTVEPDATRSINTRNTISYDVFGQMLSYTDTTVNPDGTQTVAVTSGVQYDDQGRMKGYAINTHQTGILPQIVYRIDGQPATAEVLDALLASTGRTLWELIQDPQFRITYESEMPTEPNVDKRTQAVRSDILYNSLGQMERYHEISSDPENGVRLTTTDALITYQESGQPQTQTSMSVTFYDNGVKSEIESVMSFSYAENGQLLGAVANGRTITYELPQWTDTDQDYVVDTLIPVDAVVSHSRQIFGVFNGQTRLVCQNNRSSVVNPDLSTTESTSSTISIYDEVGRLVGGVSEGQTVSRDIWDSVSTTRTAQLMTAMQGELKTVLNVSDSASSRVDGSSSHSVIVTLYLYDPRGRGTYGVGRGHSFTDDGEENITRERIVQIYAFISGQFRLMSSENYAETRDEFQPTGAIAPPEGSVPDEALLNNWQRQARPPSLGLSESANPNDKYDIGLKDPQDLFQGLSAGAKTSPRPGRLGRGTRSTLDQGSLPGAPQGLETIQNLPQTQVPGPNDPLEMTEPPMSQSFLENMAEFLDEYKIMDRSQFTTFLFSTLQAMLSSTMWDSTSYKAIPPDADGVM